MLGWNVQIRCQGREPNAGRNGSGLRACQTKVRVEVVGELAPAPQKGLLAAEKQLHTLLATKQLADTQPMALERRPAEIST